MWINTLTLETYENDVAMRAAFPDASLPDGLPAELMAAINLFPVQCPAPREIPHQTAVALPPTLLNGIWVKGWRYELSES